MRDDTVANARDEEIVCVDSLIHCLKHQCGCHDVAVQREQHDPPDFWITIDGVKYAAEVTSIVANKGYRALCYNLAQSIQRSAQQQHFLRGTYALYVIGNPPLPKRASPAWRNLITRATTFMRERRDCDLRSEILLLRNRKGRLWIEKVSSAGADLRLFGPSDAKRKPQIEQELTGLIGAAVSKKRQKMTKKGVRDLSGRVILLLYDAYGFGSVDDAQRALLQVGGYDWYHSVFWAASFTQRPNDLSPSQGGRVGRFLYSQNEDWWRRP